MHLLGLTGYSEGRLKPPEDGLPIPYWDPEGLPKPCKSRSSILVRERLEGCEKSGGYNPEPLHFGHNTRASATIQSEALLASVR